jgi:itaconate CoA-transferase
MSSPLKDILVVAVEHAAAAPYASSRLADAGARVIKIERKTGDFARGYDSAIRGQSSYFVWLNRGKESVTLDFNDKADLELLKRMVAKADVLIQNLGPGAAERAGIGWRDMRSVNPRLITCDITGYGEDGPFAGKRAYDLLVQAESGIASITGTPDAPGRIGLSACDIGTGMYAYAAILEAIVERERTGEGSAIHLSLFGAMTDWMAIPLLHYDYGGTVWPRVGLTHPYIAPYAPFRLAGGDSILIGIQNNIEWSRFVGKVLHRPELETKPEFKDNVDRVKNRPALDAVISEIFAGLDLQEAVRRLDEAQIAYASVNGTPEVSRHQQLKRVTVDTPGGSIDMVAPPAEFRGKARTLGPVPDLGQHTTSIRAEFSGS